MTSNDTYQVWPELPPTIYASIVWGTLGERGLVPPRIPFDEEPLTAPIGKAHLSLN